MDFGKKCEFVSVSNHLESYLSLFQSVNYPRHLNLDIHHQYLLRIAAIFSSR